MNIELSPALPDLVEAISQVRLPASNSDNNPIVIEEDDPSPSPVLEEIDIKPGMVSFAPSAVNTLAQPIIVATQIALQIPDSGPPLLYPQIGSTDFR